MTPPKRYLPEQRAAIDDLVNFQGFTGPAAAAACKVGTHGLPPFAIGDQPARDIAKRAREKRERDLDVATADDPPLRIVGRMARQALGIVERELLRLRAKQGPKRLSGEDTMQLKNLIGTLKDTAALVRTLPELAFSEAPEREATPTATTEPGADDPGLSERAQAALAAIQAVRDAEPAKDNGPAEASPLRVVSPPSGDVA